MRRHPRVIGVEDPFEPARLGDELQRAAIVVGAQAGGGDQHEALDALAGS